VIYATPALSDEDEHRLEALDVLRKRLVTESNRPVLWMGVLRRSVQASSVASSAAIEGFHVSQSDAVALVGGGQPDPGDIDQLAVASYGRAMRHVRAMADDPDFRWSDRVILDLHFDACDFQRDMRPGRWREGPIGVTDGDGGLVYRGPDAEDVPGLMKEVVDWIERGDSEVHSVVRAAMAHLHVVRVHPFRDGNGRVSRIVQSLVLARNGAISPEFASIEEYLSEHTQQYYAALQTTGESYEPNRDASSWIRFCIEAHLHQAERRLRQIEAAGARWTALEEIVEQRGWPERFIIALEQALVGGSSRATYGAEAEIASATATNDFRRLLDAGLIEQAGTGRNTRYTASDGLRAEMA
jgi:Fic family protein